MSWSVTYVFFSNLVLWCSLFLVYSINCRFGEDWWTLCKNNLEVGFNFISQYLNYIYLVQMLLVVYLHFQWTESMMTWFSILLTHNIKCCSRSLKLYWNPLFVESL